MINLLALVLAGHFIGDWILQTDWQAAHKTERSWLGWRANLNHIFWYTIALILVSSWGISAGSVEAHRWGVLLLVSAVTHSFIDRRWPVKWLMRLTGSEKFAETSWGVIATDQALHLSILCVLVAWVQK
jgi:hypothetical protein